MSPGAEAHIVSNLKKYTKYEFFIAPYYRSVEGQPSNSKIIQTFEDGKKHFQKPTTTTYTPNVNIIKRKLISIFKCNQHYYYILMPLYSSIGTTGQRANRNVKLNGWVGQMAATSTTAPQWHSAWL